MKGLSLRRVIQSWAIRFEKSFDQKRNNLTLFAKVFINTVFLCKKYKN